MFRIALLALSAALLAACDNSVEFESDANTLGHSAPTPTTVKANQAVLAQRPFSNTEDFELARKGLIASEDHLEIAHLTGKSLVWNMDEYGFVDANGENAPGSVNPSLWRQAALNNIHGLFKVTDGVYQIRGFDLANMTIIESESGWILNLSARERHKPSLCWQHWQIPHQGHFVHPQSH